MYLNIRRLRACMHGWNFYTSSLEDIKWNDEFGRKSLGSGLDLTLNLGHHAWEVWPEHQYFFYFLAASPACQAREEPGQGSHACIWWIKLLLVLHHLDQASSYASYSCSTKLICTNRCLVLFFNLRPRVRTHKINKQRRSTRFTHVDTWIWRRRIHLQSLRAVSSSMSLSYLNEFGLRRRRKNKRYSLISTGRETMHLFCPRALLAGPLIHSENYATNE
jgi:hypothetical protein